MLHRNNSYQVFLKSDGRRTWFIRRRNSGGKAVRWRLRAALATLIGCFRRHLLAYANPLCSQVCRKFRSRNWLKKWMDHHRLTAWAKLCLLKLECRAIEAILTSKSPHLRRQLHPTAYIYHSSRRLSSRQPRYLRLPGRWMSEALILVKLQEATEDWLYKRLHQELKAKIRRKMTIFRFRNKWVMKLRKVIQIRSSMKKDQFS